MFLNFIASTFNPPHEKLFVLEYFEYRGSRWTKCFHGHQLLSQEEMTKNGNFTCRECAVHYCQLQLSKGNLQLVGLSNWPCVEVSCDKRHITTLNIHSDKIICSQCAEVPVRIVTCILRCSYCGLRYGMEEEEYKRKYDDLCIEGTRESFSRKHCPHCSQGLL